MKSTGQRTSWNQIEDQWLRLTWVIPLSLILWAALLTLFALLLKRTAPPPPEMAPAELRIVELPPTGGLQGGAAVQHHPVAAPSKRKVATVTPKPHIKIKRSRQPAVTVHRVKPKIPVAPVPPPSVTGTSKEPAEAAPSGAASPAGREPTQAGAGRGTGTGVGIGSDSSGARAIYAPKPVIPDSLREEGFQAVAVARFKVTYDGQVQVTLTTPTESPQLNALLIETLKQWRFFPAMKSGVAIDSQFDLRIPISVE
jgi:periplasmic protein TonB